MYDGLAARDQAIRSASFAHASRHGRQVIPHIFGGALELRRGIHRVAVAPPFGFDPRRVDGCGIVSDDEIDDLAGRSTC